MSMTPTSIPAALPQPEVSVYGTDALPILKQYTFASYVAEFGVEPPPFDPTWPIQRYFDSSADASDPDNISQYLTLKTVVDLQTGAAQTVFPPVYVQLNLPSSRAAKVNLWGGAATFPAWEPASTVAMEWGASGPISSINVFMLSAIADAEALNAALGGGGIREYQPEGGPDNFTYVYGSESRRVYYFIDSNGQWQWVGFLLREQYAAGFGSPGMWVNGKQADSTSAWRWISIPQQTPPPPNTPVKAVPMRRLYPNERFISEFSMAVMIQRTDL